MDHTIDSTRQDQMQQTSNTPTTFETPAAASLTVEPQQRSERITSIAQLDLEESSVETDATPATALLLDAEY